MYLKDHILNKLLVPIDFDFEGHRKEKIGGGILRFYDEKNPNWYLS
jgi:hypothetical protein